MSLPTAPLAVRPRFLSGSGISKKIRRAGLLPAIMYGAGTEATPVAVEPRQLRKGLTSAYGRNQLFQLEIKGGESKLAIAKEVQLNPLTRQLEHVDLLLVQPDTAMIVTLPVILSGRSAGQKAGGRLEFITRHVKVSCTPATLPTSIEIDVTPFENGFVMFAEGLPLPAGVVPVFKKTFKILEIFSPKVEEVVVAAPAKKK